MEDQTRSLSEVAGLMGVSERTVRRWIKGGRLKAYKPGRDYRIPEAGLRAFIEESEISPKVQSPQLEREAVARDYVAARVEWCERVMEKTEGDFIHPFASLDAAIQWAIYVGVESAAMKNAISRMGVDASQDLRDLVDRMAAVSDRTDAKVNMIMQQSDLPTEEKEQAHLRLIQGQRSA